LTNEWTDPTTNVSRILEDGIVSSRRSRRCCLEIKTSMMLVYSVLRGCDGGSLG
jgi:hypothetical protein